MEEVQEKKPDRDLYLGLESFTDGRACRAYRQFGAHRAREDGKDGWHFRVWAPRAARVCLMGDFNGWNRENRPLRRLGGGIWEGFEPGLPQGALYKFAVHTAAGEVLDKADPYAFACELRPGTASRLWDSADYKWHDGLWMKWRRTHPVFARPMNIYEVHLGSWRRTGDGKFLTYREMAEYLPAYAKKMGYTHVELLPVTEHPLDMSWGYQVTGYFAPTSRFGEPEDFKYLVDSLHGAGVGVLLDWVPAHFPRDAFGLYRFDGTPTYEYEDVRKGAQEEWGTQVFDFGRNEVRSFLYSSALFWAEEYHADGLRVDAVASMLYLDYGREPGQWEPNVNGGKENLEAVGFLRQLNTILHREHPDVLTIAEESTTWSHVTGDHLKEDPMALGFSLKWNMGWMNDALHYQKMDPYFRQYNHRDVTFPLVYAFQEAYILPISHDEVVHMKGSLIGKMPGDDEMKFAGVRAFLVYMMTQPGKKLLMMGSEFGQFNEWHYEQSLDWHLLEQERHRQLQEFTRQLNGLYLTSPELWREDLGWRDYEWICADDAGANTLSYYRRDGKGGALIVLVNFSPVRRPGYRVGVDEPGTYEAIFNSDDPVFGGGGRGDKMPVSSGKTPCHGRADSITVDLPPLTGLLLRRIGPALPETENEPEKIAHS